MNKQIDYFVQNRKQLSYSTCAAVERTIDLIMEYESKIDEANKKTAAALNVGKFKPSVPFISVPSDYVYQLKRNMWGSLDSKDPRNYEFKMTEEDLLAKKAQNEDILKQNIAISKENEAVKVAAIEFMKNLGLSTTTTVEVKTRRRYPYNTKREKVTAAWVNEIYDATPVFSEGQKFILENDAIDRIISKLRSMKDEIAQMEAKEAQEKNLNERRIAAISLASSICDKYDIAKPASTSEGEFCSIVLLSLICKNKYLYLAHYLRKNRSDWSDGYHYAELGLNQFTIDSPIDAEINNEIESIISGGDVDGRYFRDCKWSYDALFQIVAEEDKELYDNYCKLNEYCDY